MSEEVTAEEIIQLQQHIEGSAGMCIKLSQRLSDTMAALKKGVSLHIEAVNRMFVQEANRRGLTWCTNEGCHAMAPQEDFTHIVSDGVESLRGGEYSGDRERRFLRIRRLCPACRDKLFEYIDASSVYVLFVVEKRNGTFHTRKDGRAVNGIENLGILTTPPQSLLSSLAEEYGLPPEVKLEHHPLQRPSQLIVGGKVVAELRL